MTAASGLVAFLFTDVVEPAIRSASPAPRSAGVECRPRDTDDVATSIQERYFPESICFGCGPMNESGLHIASYEADGGIVSTFAPDASHQAADGVVCGGIIGTILDCHAAGLAWLTLVDPAIDEHAVVTKEMTVRFTAPTPAPPRPNSTTCS